MEEEEEEEAAVVVMVKVEEVVVEEGEDLAHLRRLGRRAAPALCRHPLGAACVRLVAQRDGASELACDPTEGPRALVAGHVVQEQMHRGLAVKRCRTPMQ